MKEFHDFFSRKKSWGYEREGYKEGDRKKD